MKIHSVFDPAFKRYGQVVEGLPDTVSELLEALQKTPLPEGSKCRVTEVDGAVLIVVGVTNTVT